MYSQLDPKWNGIYLGVGNRTTIGSHGCLLSCGAAINFNFGTHHDPGTLNYYLQRNQGYVPSSNRLIFAKLGEPAGLSCEVIDCSRSPAPVGRIWAALDSGAEVLAKVDFSPGGGVQEHWVRMLRFERDDVVIQDPWLQDGGPYLLLARYAHFSWPGGTDGIARAIYRLVFYTKEHQSGVFTPTGVFAYSQKKACKRVQKPRLFRFARGFGFARDKLNNSRK